MGYFAKQNASSHTSVLYLYNLKCIVCNLVIITVFMYIILICIAALTSPFSLHLTFPKCSAHQLHWVSPPLVSRQNLKQNLMI